MVWHFSSALDSYTDSDYNTDYLISTPVAVKKKRL